MVGAGSAGDAWGRGGAAGEVGLDPPLQKENGGSPPGFPELLVGTSAFDP